jgi:serine protease Do
MRMKTTLTGILLLIAPACAAAEDKPLTVEQLAEKTRPSVVVIRVGGRAGGEGVGTGFVVSADGLIATNMHVIGQGRAITVETADGKKLPVKAVHAYDRARDLAVIRVDGKGLTPLSLGKSATLRDGQAVVAMGNPQGLRHSVVAGVVSGKRKIEGREMIQIAIPIEPGNSGGPLLDRRGNVVGLLTIKSLVTDNLGFAVAVEELRPLLAKPRPVPYAAWRTIGVLDPDLWEPRLGGRWRQRAGRILADEPGTGFGGRTFCLSKEKVPALPYEVGVTVRLDDESGAAGLIFYADGGDKHYGFYPSGGKLRLVRFAGDTVFSWKILKNEASPHYRPGAWNYLKVRLEKGLIRCFVNDEPVFTLRGPTWESGRAGLAKFRTTSAEFKRFQIAKELPRRKPPADLVRRVRKAVEGLDPDKAAGKGLLDKLRPEGPGALKALRAEARELEQRAAKLRELALAVHHRQVLARLARAVAGKEEKIDLIRAALLIALLDNEEVDVEGYREEVARMAGKVRSALPAKADDEAKLAALNKFLFEERGFHGSRDDYYQRSNSYLSEVIDDREGLPITLSLLYLALARQIGLKAEGVGMPGHFVVRIVLAKGGAKLVDVFDGGKVLTREQAAKKVEKTSGLRLRDEHLRSVGPRAVLVRILHNLLNVAQRERDPAGALRYLDAILTVTPDAAEERAMRAGVRYQQGDRKGSLEDIDWLLVNKPEGIDLDRVREFRRVLTEE